MTEPTASLRSRLSRRASVEPFLSRARQQAVLPILALLLLSIRPALAQSIQYERPVQTAPQENTIGGGYKTPAVQKPLPRHYWLQVLDVVLLAAAMGLSVWIVLSRRSRKWLLGLTIGSLAYFGFYREGCICPIGSIQNVAVALTDPKYSIPIVVTATFFLPLVAAIFFGRAFCGGVCALGAIQELVLLRPVTVPRRLDRTLGLLRYVYLALAIFFALKPALAREFLICRFDPFVGLFRRTGPPHMLIAGGAARRGYVRGTPVLPLPVPLQRTARLVHAPGAPRSDDYAG